MLENEYWILTIQDAKNAATLLKANSECEVIINPEKQSLPYEECLLHAKKQLKRNLSLNEKQLKILSLKKMIEKNKRKFEEDINIKEIFIRLEDWYDHLGRKCKLNKIFLIENKEHLSKIENYNI